MNESMDYFKSELSDIDQNTETYLDTELQNNHARQKDTIVNEEDISHNKVVNDDELVFPCDQCDFESSLKKNLVEHKTKEHQKLSCDECDYRTNSTKYMRTHKVRHHGKEKDQPLELIKCPTCEFETKSSQYLSIHIESKHSIHPKIRYSCNLCEYENFRKQNVQTHQKRNHTNLFCKIKDKNCDYCQTNVEHKTCNTPKISSGRKNKPRRILVKVESNVIPKEKIELQCKECSYTTKDKRYFKNHQMFNHSKSQAGDKPVSFQCNKCELQARSEQVLKTHIESIHENQIRFMCSLCEFGDYRKQIVIAHQKTNHEDLICKIVSVGCKLCENGNKHSHCRFRAGNVNLVNKRIKKKYKRIDKTDPDDKIFSCEECEFQTRNHHTLKNHMESIHMGLVKFSCNICIYKSYQQHHVREHQMSNHPDQACHAIRIGCEMCSIGKEHYTCKLEEDIPSGLKQVLTYPYSRKIKRYSCEKCGKTWCSKHLVIKHVKRAHEGEDCRVIGIGCNMCEAGKWHNICNFRSGLKSPVQDEVEPEEIKRKRLTCDQCAFQTRGKVFMHRHKENVHLGVRRYSCSACTFQAYNKQHVKEHHTQKHQAIDCKVVGIGCLHCEENISHPRCVFLKNRNFEDDVDEERLYLCKECPFKTNRKDVLVPHQESVHQGILKFSCGLCDMKSYYRQSVVIHHKRFHNIKEMSILRVDCVFCKSKEVHETCSSGQSHPKKPKERVEKRDGQNAIVTCKLCNEILPSKGELRKHYHKNHKGQNLFSCDSCAYGSNWKANIKTHKETKHLDISYTCDKCGFKSKWNTQFLEHRREKHGLFQKKSKNNKKGLCDQCGFSTGNWNILVKHQKQHKQG